MGNPFKILVDRLKNEKEQHIQESVDVSFLGVDEPTLHYEGVVKVDGTVQLQHQEVLLNLNVEAQAHTPCTICTEDVTVDVKIKHFITSYHLDEVKSETLDYSSAIRDCILLETPKFAECMNNCSKRGELKTYLADPKKKKKQQPFENIDL